MVQFHKSILWHRRSCFTFSGCDYKYESLEGASFLPRNNLSIPPRSFCHGEEQKDSKGPRSGRRKGLNSQKKTAAAVPRRAWGGAQAHGEGLHRLNSCWDRWTIVFPYGQLQHRADWAGKTGRARATWDNDCQATHILHQSKCFSFHTSTFYSEQKIKLCGKYIYVYIYIHNRNCSNWVKDKVT